MTRDARTITPVVAVLLIVVLAGILMYTVGTSRSAQPGVAVLTASPTPPSPTSVPPTASPATTTASPTAPPVTKAGPFASPLYVNAAHRFSVVLPAPYRNSGPLSLANTGSQRPVAHDAFTARTDDDETAQSARSCQTACPIWNYVAVVIVNAGAGAQTPRQWYTAFSGAVGETIEDMTVDGRPAVKITNGARFPVQFVVKDGDRMFELAYQIYSADFSAVPPSASRDKLDQILASFRFTP